MRVDFAHIRERSASGGWIDYAVFDARASAGTDAANAKVSAELTAKATLAGFKIDQSALAFREQGSLKFYGTKALVAHLAKVGLPQWTNWIDA